MSYSIRIDAERRVVFVVVSDVFNAASAPQMTTEARNAAAASGFNVLYDIRCVVSGKLENADVFWWPRKIPVLQGPEARRIRAAVLHGPAHRAIVQFWETAYRNVGLQASGFEDEAAALRWLTDK
jgi:hypothetical protein